MAKKNNLVRAGKEANDPSIKAFPMENKRARRPLGGILLFLSGGSLLGSGIILGPASGRFAALETPLNKLTEFGLQPDILMLGGSLLIGLGLLSRHMRLHIQTLLQRDQSERALTEMGGDLAEFSNRLVEFQADHLHFRTELESMGRNILAHQQNDRSGEAADGLFRLAGSLDQLSARVEGRLNESMAGVGQSLHELGTLVAASRDFLQESVEDNAEGIRLLTEGLQKAQTDLDQVQLKTTAAMQLLSQPQPQPQPAEKVEATAETTPTVEPEPLTIFDDSEADSPVPDDAFTLNSLNILDEMEAGHEEPDCESPLALFEEADEDFGMLPPAKPTAEQPEIQPEAETPAPLPSPAPATAPLDKPIPLELKQPEPLEMNLPEAATEPFGALPSPKVPPALEGEAFTTAPVPKSGPMEIQLDEDSDTQIEGDKPNDGGLGQPPIGF